MVKALPPQPGAPLCAFTGCTNHVRLANPRKGHWRKFCSKHRKRIETQRAQELDKRCEISGCGEPVVQSRNYCAKHVTRYQKFGEFEPEFKSRRVVHREGICAVPSCDRPQGVYARPGYQQFLPFCYAHYNRQKTYGDVVEAVPVPAPHSAVKEWLRLHGKADA